jgi:hypothetical protein
VNRGCGRSLRQSTKIGQLPDFWNLRSAPGFAEQCVAEYDLDGRTVPDLINPER